MKEGLREKRKRQLKSELSRQAIQLFTQKGFEETTIDDIVGPLAVSKRTLFRHFATKEDLVFAWYEELTDELVRELEARPRTEAPFESVCETLRSLLKYYDENPKWALAMTRLAKATPALLGKSFEKRSIWERELAKVLAKRLPNAPGRDLTARVTVAAALAAFTCGIDEWTDSRGKPDIRVCLDRAFSVVRSFA
ncbi:MAG TPA: TetR/AcrR family transcriptional regulator [Polyangia bacterium]|nr:TetR/AcrR family transcriptional regulator [Polyangia bacterium]